SGGLWTAQEAPAPTPSTDGEIVDTVACPSTSECIAGGGVYTSPTTSEYEQPMLLTWAGGEWTAAAAPMAPGAGNTGTDSGGGVRSVSCPSVSVCAADGWYWATPAAEPEMLLNWSGGNWTVTKAPVPADAVNSSAAWAPLEGSLACRSVSECIGVGF